MIERQSEEIVRAAIMPPGVAVTQLHASLALEDPHDGWMTVWSVRVDEDRRRQGLGRSLMREAIAFADEQGCGLRLRVFECNEPAIQLYHSVGFAIVDTTRQAYPARAVVHVMERPCGGSQ